MPSLFENFKTLFKLYNEIFNKVCSNQGYNELSVNNYQYIYTIYCLKRATVTNLSRALNIKKSSVTNMIEVLGKKGYVKRAASVDDKRSITISLSEKGMNLIKLEEKVQREFVDECRNILSEKEMEQFSNLLNKITDTIIKRKKS